MRNLMRFDVYQSTSIAPVFLNARYIDIRTMKEELDKAFCFECVFYDNKVRITFHGKRTYTIPKKVKDISSLQTWLLSKNDWEKTIRL